MSDVIQKIAAEAAKELVEGLGVPDDARIEAYLRDVVEMVLLLYKAQEDPLDKWWINPLLN